jgi:predicted permease
VLLHIAAIIAPLFVCAGIGFVWGRLGRPFDAQMVTGLALSYGMPCLILSSLTRLDVSGEAFVSVGGAYALALVAGMAMGVLVSKLLGLDLRVYAPVLAFSNSGNMGLPLCLFAFGEAGLPFAFVNLVVSSVVSMTASGAFYSGRTSFDIFYKNPLLFGVLAAIPFLVVGARLPTWLANTTELIGGMAIPLMLIALGVAIAKLRMIFVAKSLGLSALKLVLCFGIGVAVAEITGLEGVARGTLILMFSMPVALHNYVFAQRFERRADEVAGMVLASTALSFLTLPLLLWAVL